jgi:hypothetical protein
MREWSLEHLTCGWVLKEMVRGRHPDGAEYGSASMISLGCRARQQMVDLATSHLSGYRPVAQIGGLLRTFSEIRMSKTYTFLDAARL